MSGALDGIRVIDFGQYIAGPLAAVMLADQGADVIHVDPPGGPLWKSPADAFFQRGKRRISLDLKKPQDNATAQKLIASATWSSKTSGQASWIAWASDNRSRRPRTRT